MGSSTTNTKIYGHMVVKDEADRYLQASLHYLSQLCDKVVVVDDASTDSSPEIIKSFENVIYMRRPMRIPTFMEHEGAFRKWAWETVGDILNAEGRWVISADADDLVVGSRPFWEDIISLAEEEGKSSIRSIVPEVWSMDPLSIRTDGYWALNYAEKVAKWEDGFSPAELRMGGGSVPMTRGRVTLPDPLFYHFGYANPKDREEKFHRYSSLGHQSGHNPAHINSIVAKPALLRVEGLPEFWRGVR